MITLIALIVLVIVMWGMWETTLKRFNKIICQLSAQKDELKRINKKTYKILKESEKIYTWVRKINRKV
jgi:hypothetical protein